MNKKDTVYETDIETYLPEINMTLLRDLDIPTHHNETQLDVTEHETELTKLKAKLETINSDLQRATIF